MRQLDIQIFTNDGFLEERKGTSTLAEGFKINWSNVSPDTGGLIDHN